MEYDYERSNAVNKMYSMSPTCSSSSSTASSNSSTGALLQSKQQSSQNAIPSSNSTIFATAASFNICQNDTVHYSRETIHLIAKFLSVNSENPIFRSLFAFAPDNLAWLWSFIDWDKPLDLSTIPCQEVYTPFKPTETFTINEADLNEVNKLFLDAPLLQYKYREPIMIGDLYKFIEHVSKTEHSVVARALFLIYFPRFASHMNNPLKDIIRVKVLKANLNLIKRVDETIISLIRSRYCCIDTYKQNIQRGINLPSYIRSLLKENNCLSGITDESAVSPDEKCSQVKPKLVKGDEAAVVAHSKFKTTKIEEEMNKDFMTSLNLNNEVFTNQNESVASEIEELNDLASPSVFFPVAKTMDYMKLLEQSSQINDDLDHISFDKKKALFRNQQDNLDHIYDNNNNHLLLNNINLPENCQLDEVNQFGRRNNESECVVTNDDNNEYQDSQFAAKYIDLICNSSEDSTANLNLATLTLPQLTQLSNLAETYSNCGSPRLGSPSRHENSFQYNSNQRTISNSCQSSKLSFSKLPTVQNMNSSACMSPSSPKFNTKPVFYTPKTPSSLSQYHEKQADYSVWSNVTTPNAAKMMLPNNNRFYESPSVTPPPSATFRTSPLSVVTNNYLPDQTNGNYPIGSKLNSPNCSGMLSPTTGMFNKSLNLNSSLMQDELNNYLKHQFYGSPVPRGNKLNEYRSNGKMLQKNDLSNAYYSNLKMNKYNSNAELNYKSGLNTNANVFFQRNHNQDLNFDDMNSPKSPSSTSGSNHFTYNHRANNNNAHNNQNQHTWCGRLPPKIYSENSIYSRKVFLGGLPWDVNQSYLVQLLQKYGSVKLEIPGKDQKHPRVSNISKSQERSTPGYVYIIYEHESSVQRMLADCRKEVKNGGEHYFYTIFIPPTNTNNNSNFYFNSNMSNKRGKAKEVEVIPWNQEDTSYVPQNKTSMLPAKIDAKTTIFVGALHGMLNAHGLAKVMNEVFGEVIHAGLDTDKYKYPIGSGRVTFRNRQSYVKAIRSKFVTIKANLESTDPSPKFEKTIQIDPYLEDAKCFKCNNRSYFFCRNEYCLDYYCEACWKNNHDMVGNGEHQSLSRQNKPDQMNKIFK